jgi:hypothetical protein
MTNRRPDIHCDGCGTYCYSLSHIPSQQVFPSIYYCDRCSRALEQGIRPGVMLNKIWTQKSGNVLERFQKVRKLSERELGTIRSFQTFTGVHIKDRKLTGDSYKMTAVEWKEVAKEKLAGLREHYTRRQIILLNAFIDSAPCRGDLLPLKKRVTKRQKNLNDFLQALTR